MASIRGPIQQVTKTPPPELKVETAPQDADTSGKNGLANEPSRGTDTSSKSPGQSAGALLAPTPPVQTPSEGSPDRLSPLTTGHKLQGALKKPGASGTRLATHRTSDHSPLRLSPGTIEPDHVPNGTSTPPPGRKG